MLAQSFCCGRAGVFVVGPMSGQQVCVIWVDCTCWPSYAITFRVSSKMLEWKLLFDAQPSVCYYISYMIHETVLFTIQSFLHCWFKYMHIMSKVFIHMWFHRMNINIIKSFESNIFSKYNWDVTQLIVWTTKITSTKRSLYPGINTDKGTGVVRYPCIHDQMITLPQRRHN